MHKKRISSGVHVSSREPTKKCVMKMKGGGEEKKRHVRKNYIHGRKPFITLILRNYESDLLEPQGNDYEYNKGTIC